MNKSLTWRWVLIGIVVALPPAGVAARDQDQARPRLRGGIHLVLRVNTDDAVRAEVDDAMERTRGELTGKGFPPAELQRLDSGDGFSFRPLPTPTRASSTSWSRSGCSTSPSSAARSTPPDAPEVTRAVRDMAVRQGLETIRNRVDQFGVAEPLIQRQGIEGDRIVVQLPASTTRARQGPDPRHRVLEIKPVVNAGPSEEALRAAAGGTIPSDSEIVAGEVERGEAGTYREYYLLKKASVITGRDLRSSRRSQDQYGQAAVSFNLNPDGARKFESYTGAHIGDRMAIVLDNKVRSAPVIRGQIGDSGIIEGNFTIEAAEDLALVLRAARAARVDHYSRSAPSGQASAATRSSRHARRPGRPGGGDAVHACLLPRRRINANVALLLNALILLGAMVRSRRR